MSVDVSAVRYVTMHCLFRRVDFLRLVVSGAAGAPPSKPVIVWGRLWPMAGGRPLIISDRSEWGAALHLQRVAQDESHPDVWPLPGMTRAANVEDAQRFERVSFEGAIIITDIDTKGTAVTRLRLCHAQSGPDMIRGLRYYNLFSLDGYARSVLKTATAKRMAKAAAWTKRRAALDPAKVSEA